MPYDEGDYYGDMGDMGPPPTGLVDPRYFYPDMPQDRLEGLYGGYGGPAAMGAMMGSPYANLPDYRAQMMDPYGMGFQPQQAQAPQQLDYFNPWVASGVQANPGQGLQPSLPPMGPTMEELQGLAGQRPEMFNPFVAQAMRGWARPAYLPQDMRYLGGSTYTPPLQQPPMRTSQRPTSSNYRGPN